ncbi:uncharacterized protein F4812DRAFT_464534 [Daldinia caldariorum]|uniref:uncharacterized protein n=1 Tax=Daldinia caldariorum TaxID=326644 RepID=UPI0020081BA6|nr:uncharacterized protein F4812DRAFT_464534 [Daldinia caldariorum]KAI1472423.1 hypothetical protein F4812DRAFT_464534 [Daldinia caldariorum]
MTEHKSPMDLKFDELPDPRRVWVGKPGSREEGLGRLALLTEDRVRRAAAQEIRTGRRVGLNWDVRKLEFPNLGRSPCRHQIVPILGGVAFDDVYTMNPQQSSQWDGLRHWSAKQSGPPADQQEQEGERVFYGGTTKDEILDRSSDRIGTQHWAREGITGRGVLIDYARWAARRGIRYSAFSTHAVTLRDMQDIAREHDLAFERGDILLVRSGAIREWEHGMDTAAKTAYAASRAPEHAGVEATAEVLRWLWDTGFAAVAGDALSWEVYPPQSDVFLHDVLLAGWGMPIGELFDLERLAEICEELNRWSFFFTSMPLNMPGGVSSPPNAQAIF